MLKGEKNDFSTIIHIDARIYTLYIGILGGIASLALDVDHLFILWREGIPVTLNSLVTLAGRPWHIPVLIGSGILCIGAFAYNYRLLRGKHAKKN